MAPSRVTQVINRQRRPSIVQHRGQEADVEVGGKEGQPNVADAETFQRRLQHKVEVVEGGLPLYHPLFGRYQIWPTERQFSWRPNLRNLW